MKLPSKLIVTMTMLIIPPLPEGGGGYTVLPLSVQDILCRIFLSNCWWQKSDILSQASYRYTILWVAFLDPSDSYFLFADLVGFYTHWTYMHIFRYIFLRFLLPVCQRAGVSKVSISSQFILLKKTELWKYISVWERLWPWLFLDGVKCTASYANIMGKITLWQ